MSGLYLVAVFEVEEALNESHGGAFAKGAHVPDLQGRLLIRLVKAKARALADG